MSRHHRTRFVDFDLRRCEACWRCVGACPREVLGRIAIFRHRHVHVNHADNCRGCQACVRACENGAIVALPRERPVVQGHLPHKDDARLAETGS